MRDFPLAWPEGVDRTLPGDRVDGRFKADFRATYDAVLDEAERLRDDPGREIVISTNVPLDAEERPVVAATKQLGDPGACVYVFRGGRPHALACDTYREVRHNLRAIWATIRALRTIERHATAGLLERSMVGHCREVGAGDTVEVPQIAAAGCP